MAKRNAEIADVRKPGSLITGGDEVFHLRKNIRVEIVIAGNRNGGSRKSGNDLCLDLVVNPRQGRPDIDNLPQSKVAGIVTTIALRGGILGNVGKRTNRSDKGECGLLFGDKLRLQ